MIALFCCRLICGASLCWALMPRQQITCGFFRIQHLVVLGFSVVAALTVPAGVSTGTMEFLWSTGVTRALIVLTAVVAYIGSVVWTLDRRTLGCFSIVLILALSSVAMLGLQPLMGGAESSATRVLAAASELSSAALLGTALTGMLLGHWYLTATSMPLAPLLRMDQLFVGAVVLRALVAWTGWLLFPGDISGPVHQVWLSLRWLSGIVAPFVLGIMIWKILKFRNTQSATGVFFAGVILVFMGELAALLLSYELQFPL